MPNSTSNLELRFNNQVATLVPGAVVVEIFKQIKPEAKNVIGIKLTNERLKGELIDLQTPLYDSGEFTFVSLSDDSDDTKLFYRHSFSHILAQAVRRLYPNTKLAIGPAVENGFYYDFDVEQPFTPEVLEKLSKEMEKIIKEDHKFERLDVSLEEGRKIIKDLNDPYKQELFDSLVEKGAAVSFYRDGDFIDLCRGPHVKSTGAVKFFKLTDLAGAYWRGDETKKMLQRVYGTAFLKKEDLETYLHNLEEAKKRDHRRVGKELDLFSTNAETVGGGLILWHPKGGLIRHLIEEHCKDQHIQGGYDFVYTPHIGRASLWETSGHLSFYKDSMYAPIEIEGQEFYLKPMNCPFHVQIFKSRVRSYRDLPKRFAEWGTVYRFERSGTLHGLTRVRGFTQDDAHLFCRPDQVATETKRVLEFSIGLLQSFGFSNFKLKLSTRPAERVGADDLWDLAEASLQKTLEESGLPWELNPGDGAFYGPKIDIAVNDAIGRAWQLSTVQFDFNLPERFDLSFIGEDGKEHRPFMVHRALLGSMERFFGLLIENHGGAFPVWLSPVQTAVLSVSDRHAEYAYKVAEKLKEQGIRAEVETNNTLNYRIREAQNQKVPYMLIVGDKEVEAETVSVRVRNGEDLGALSVDDAAEYVLNKIRTKELL
jgi:threonyl-tRNA synthetase